MKKGIDKRTVVCCRRIVAIDNFKLLGAVQSQELSQLVNISVNPGYDFDVTSTVADVMHSNIKIMCISR